MKVKIKEQSFFAKIAARKLKSKTVAIVFGNTIHLWNVSREDFLQCTTWVIHEIAHVRQFKRYGFVWFCFLYLLETAKTGYYNNKYEIEARAAETSKEINLDSIEFM